MKKLSFHLQDKDYLDFVRDNDLFVVRVDEDIFTSKLYRDIHGVRYFDNKEKKYTIGVRYVKDFYLII